MKITVIGGGNIGTLMAAELLHRGHKVTICSSRPDAWKRDISVLDSEENLLFKADVYKVTDCMEEALRSAELVFVTVPAQQFGAMAQRMEPYVKPGMMIGIIPGSGGAEMAFLRVIQKGCTLFGFQRVHSIARIKKYGKAVYMLGRKPKLHIGTVPSCANKVIAPLIEQLFEMPCTQLPNYLCVTLTPSNPILHTARLYDLFREYRPGKVYPKNYLFYEEWDDAASEVLIACDGELQKLCAEIPLELETVRPLQEHYESYTISSMTAKIRSIRAFKGLLSPMRETEGGWAPDFESRYFTADFSYGLKVIAELADLFAVPVPNIDRVWRWYESVNQKDAQNAFRLNMDKDSFIALYGRQDGVSLDR